MIGKSSEFVLPVNIILFSILTSGCITEDDDDQESEPSGPVTLNDAPTVLNETNRNQSIAFVLMSYGDTIKWADMKIQISKDGNTYYVITFNSVISHPLNITCEPIGNNENVTRWEPGEKIWFYEDSGNYEPGTYFYCMIVHTSSSAAPILDSRVMVY